MFYSQFILAKKGPLGTIWIAAHLERKLRKNQVADTDIGVSVDSILSPDVPIALRLTSHLLVGVVRIYSRKVNYLFDDCSEALLKIKQAFRSTAVDLPPEESTAPYHSITMPETFDLDDFELPDNDIFQGNYVDRHISSRDQITLQDTMEGVVYSTSQFGLDERFGDGDASGLDLDEELLVDKVAAVEHGNFMLSSDADHRASDQPMTPIKQVEICEGMAPSSVTILGISNDDQIEGLDEDTAFEYAQAPCTPGLVEEPNLSNVQDTSAYDDHQELEDHNMAEFVVKENLVNSSIKSDTHHGLVGSSLNERNPDTFLCMPLEENGYHAGYQVAEQLKLHEKASNLDDQVGVIPPASEFSDKSVATSDCPDSASDLQKQIFSNKEVDNPSTGRSHEDCVEVQGARLVANIPDDTCLDGTCQPESEGALENSQALFMKQISGNAEISRNLNELCSPSYALESKAESHDRTNDNLEPTVEKNDSNILNPAVYEEVPRTEMHVLQPCNTFVNRPVVSNPEGDKFVDSDLPSEVAGLFSVETYQREEHPPTSGASSVVQGEGNHATDDLELVVEEKRAMVPSSREDIQAICNESNDPAENLISTTSFATSDLPAPERLLCAPGVIGGLESNLLMETTPEKVVSVDDGGASKINVGKKRTYTESTLTVRSLNSVESVGAVCAKGTADSIPDDDDLLSSILVGRKSSFLKVKPTPPSAITSLKRPRTVSRINAYKRKVLMDDTMVLHGDTIRQQLTSTEDLRRIRKKAPCTRPEISMIERQFWDDETFFQPIVTGVSMELTSLHNQTYDLSQIIVSKDEVNNVSFEVAKDLQLISQNEERGDAVLTSQIHESGNVGAANDLNPSGINATKENVQWDNVPLPVRECDETRHAETPALYENQEDDRNADVGATWSQMKPTIDVAEPSRLENGFWGEAQKETNEMHVSASDEVHHIISDGMDSSHTTDVVLGGIQMDAPILSPNKKFNILPVEMGACMIDMSGKVIDAIKTGEKNDDEIAAVKTDLQMDVPAVSPDKETDTLSIELAFSMIDKSEKGIEAAEKNDDDINLGETKSSSRGEPGTDRQTDCSAHSKNSNPPETSSPEAVGCHNQVATINEAMEEFRKNEQGVINDDGTLEVEMEYNSKNVTSDFCAQECVTDSSYPLEVDVDTKTSWLDGLENPNQQEVYPLGMMNAGVSAIGHVDHDDFDYSAVGPDTEFLNVDDDDDDEVAEGIDDDMPIAEETRFLENSGWSSRTRAVAKYLQILFDKEAERGRRLIPVDSLLVGKSRKEASRMFFEALVLKTRDYIHVEQESPFGNININPRSKLMKSDF